MISLILHELRVRRRAIVGWAIGLGFFTAMYMGFYPALPEELLDLDMASIDIYKSMGVQTMATFDGYMRSTVFNFLPLLVGVLGLVLGTGALAGEEDAGTLEHLAALPVSRTRLYAAKALAAMLAALVVLVVVAAAMAGLFLAIRSEIETTVTAVDLFRVVLANWLIAFVFLALGLFLGAILPSGGAARSTASALLVVAFFGNNLAGMVEDLERVQPILPFSYMARVSESLLADVPWDDVAVLTVMGLALLVAGAVAFARRDLTVGAWPWSGARRGRMPAGSALVGAPSTPMTVPNRRRPAPAAVGGAVVLACALLGAVALAVSSDLRQDVRDALGLTDDVVLASGRLVATASDVAAPTTGIVSALEVEVGDEVVGDDVLVLLEVQRGDPILAARDVLESGWALLDEATGAAPMTVRSQLADLVEGATATAEAADRALADAVAAGESSERTTELETLSNLAAGALRIVEARLALVEGTLSEADLEAAATAMDRAQAVLEAGAAPTPTGAVAKDPAPRPVAAQGRGVVAALLVQVGDAVTAGQPLARIVGPVELTVRASRDDADRIETGQDVELEVDGITGMVTGQVVEVYEMDAAEARTSGDETQDGAADADADAQDDEDLPMVVRISVRDPDGRLGPGMRAEARIELD